MTAGVTERVRRDGSVVFEAQVARPRVDGRPQSPLSKRFATQELALQWRRATVAALRARREQPEPRVAPAHTLRSWTAEWLPDSHLSAPARRYAQGRLAAHVLPVLGDRQLAQIRPTDLNKLYRDVRAVRTGRPVARATLVRIHGVVSQVLGAAVAQGLIDRNPAADVRLPRRAAPPREIEAWSSPQVAAFLAFGPVQASPLHPLLLVAFHTGLRRSELLGLLPMDVRLLAKPEPELSVRRSFTADDDTAPKTEQAHRNVPLTPAAVQALRGVLAARTEGPCQAPQLFLDRRGRPLSPTAVSKAFQRLVDKFIASPQGQEVHATRLTLHGTRHSYVTNLLAGRPAEPGVPAVPPVPVATVSKLAGHSSAAFTISRYYRLLPEHAAAAVLLYAEVA